MKQSSVKYSHRRLAANMHFLAWLAAKKPLFFSRLVRNYTKALRNTVPPPLRQVDVIVTSECNMECSHCSTKNMREPEDGGLRVRDYAYVAKELLGAGALFINFTGGEPLLKKNLAKIIDSFSPARTFVSVSTNGVLLTRERLEELKQAGVDAINISLDASTAPEHDTMRNYVGCYEKALAGAKAASRMGFRVNICYVLTSQNLDSIDRQQVVAMARGIGANVYYHLASPIGAWAGQTEHLLTPEDREKLNALLDQEPYTRTDQEINYTRSGCGAFKERVCLSPVGEIMPCPFIQVSFGNILHRSFQEIQERAFAHPCFKEYHPVCLAAEDLDFIHSTKCYDPDSKGRPMPIHYTRAFA